MRGRRPSPLDDSGARRGEASKALGAGRPCSGPERARRARAASVAVSSLRPHADVAELVDAHGSGPCLGNQVEVRVLSSASGAPMGGARSPPPARAARIVRPAILGPARVSERGPRKTRRSAQSGHSRGQAARAARRLGPPETSGKHSQSAINSHLTRKGWDPIQYTGQPPDLARRRVRCCPSTRGAAGMGSQKEYGRGGDKGRRVGAGSRKPLPFSARRRLRPRCPRSADRRHLGTARPRPDPRRRSSRAPPRLDNSRLSA